MPIFPFPYRTVRANLIRICQAAGSLTPPLLRLACLLFPRQGVPDSVGPQLANKTGVHIKREICKGETPPKNASDSLIARSTRHLYLERVYMQENRGKSPEYSDVHSLIL